MHDIRSFVAAANVGVTGEVAVEKLFGQASARQYFRVRAAGGFARDGEKHESLVVMKLPGGFASPAEEITKIAPDAPDELPFLNVQRYLKGLGLNVPAVFATDAPRGLVLLEDLGDRTLESLVKNAEGGYFVFYYKKALDVLVALQAKTLGSRPRDCICAYRSFTEELLNWEFDHFLEYGIEDRFGVRVSPGERETFFSMTRDVSRRIAAQPQGFVHRDFQSRNLMFKNYEFYLLDFQDALTGPAVYDLVALLRDSYVAFTPAQRDELIAYYAGSLPAGHPYAGREKDLMRDFNLVALQRKLKDTGRFQYIKTVKNNPGFLPHVPQSLIYVREAFEALPEYAGLRRLIARYVPELE